MEFTIFEILALLFFLGFLAQWGAWGFRLPSILLLFGAGLLIGPVTGLFQPDELFGSLLFPLVSALIGVILFEGGLSLEYEELEDLRNSVIRIIVLGILVTFLLTSFFAYFLLDFPLSFALITGGILVVTGPTVVIPLLNQIRPKGDAGIVARWEGIIIDPIGALLAVIVFDVIIAGYSGALQGFGLGFVKFGYGAVIGTGIGFISAWLLVQFLRRFWIPDHLHNFAILAMVLTSQAAANHFVHEAGLFTVTVMGMFMANQKEVAIKHIVHFKEELRTLFISALFLVLVARLDLSFITEVNTSELLFLGALILLVRPAAVVISSLGTELSWPERGFLAWIAPRGIVAAAMASIFSKGLGELDAFSPEQTMEIANITFLVIAGTVAVYGLTLPPLSRWLGLSEKDPQGLLLIGAHNWARELAALLQEENVPVRLIDKNYRNIHRTRNRDLPATFLDVLSAADFQRINIQGLGHLLALTPNDEANTIAAMHGRDVGFPSANVFQVSPVFDPAGEQAETEIAGRRFVSDDFTYSKIEKCLKNDWTLRTYDVTEGDTEESLRKNNILPLIQIQEGPVVHVATEDGSLNLEAGDRLIVLAKET